MRSRGCGGQGKQMSYIPSFGEDEDLHGINPLEQSLQPPLPHGAEGTFHASEDTVP
jgi:hypothetical protein